MPRRSETYTRKARRRRLARANRRRITRQRYTPVRRDARPDGPTERNDQ